jgi:quercetin dioxygenase-like cupin family protein
MNQDVFIEDESIAWDDLGGGVRRKIMAYDDRVMLVKVAFEAGSIGTIHQHPHTQLSHIQEGVFEVEIGGKKQVLKAGDAFFAPRDTDHGVRCLEKGVLVDVFSPMREDFI